MIGIYGEATKNVLWIFSSVENLEERWQDDARVDLFVLKFLKDKWAGTRF